MGCEGSFGGKAVPGQRAATQSTLKPTTPHSLVKELINTQIRSHKHTHMHTKTAHTCAALGFPSF